MHGELTHNASECSELPQDVSQQAWPWPSLVMGAKLCAASDATVTGGTSTTARCEALLLVEVGPYKCVVHKSMPRHHNDSDSNRYT
jgi:hypothetical protein